MNEDLERWFGGLGEEMLRRIGLREGQTVLDFGCGTGDFSIAAAQVVGPRGRVYALDMDERDLDRAMALAAERNLDQVERMDSSGAPPIHLPDGSVDVVIVYDILHYFYFPEAEQRAPLIEEFWRIVRDGGTLSLYPKHLHSHTRPTYSRVISELELHGFRVRDKVRVTLPHESSLEEGQVINFGKGGE
ncbi:MAG: class I SAM-dependent methyltransferase [Methanomassiliicoccales archaeon]